MVQFNVKHLFAFILIIGVGLINYNKAFAQQTDTSAINFGDTYVRQDVPDRSEGGDSWFSVQWYQPFLATNHGMLEFALPSGSDSITKISLFLYAYGFSSGTFSDCNIYQNYSTFTEGTAVDAYPADGVTWNTAPAYNFGTVVSSVSSISQPGWIEFPLRGAGATNSIDTLTWGDTCSFRIRFADESGATKAFGFHSKEYTDTLSYRPYIKITYLTPFVPAAFNWNNGNVQQITLSANRSLTFTNPKNGGLYSLIIKQDGTGNWVASWPSNVKWAGGIAPTLTSNPNAVDLVKFVYDGTNYLESDVILDIK